MKRVKLSGQTEDGSECKKKDPMAQLVAVTLLENQILTNPLITDRIFAEVPYSDILSCSLVSKGWNLTCRGILVERFRTYFTLSEQSTVERLEDFYNVMSSPVPGHENPVNGVRVNFRWPVKEWEFSSEPFVGTIKRIMELLEVKHLSLDMSRLRELTATDFCNIFNTMVIPHLRTLAFLEILNLDGIGNLIILSQELKVGSLPNLKELNMNWTEDRRGTMEFEFFERILRACPNLKNLPPLLPFQLPALRTTKKLYLASKIRFNYMSLTSADMQLLQEYSALIKYLEISQHDDEHRNLYEGVSISGLEPLFSSNLKHNLERFSISLDLLVAILLQKTSPVLQNLKELSCQGSPTWLPCLLKNKEIRLERFLPNLKSVTFCWIYKYSSWLRRKYGSGEYSDAPLSLFACKAPGSLDSVTALKLVGLNVNYASRLDENLTKIMDLNEVFPHVTNLDIQINISDFEDLLRWICESWGDILQVLVLRRTQCLGFHEDAPPKLRPEWRWRDLPKSKRKPLPLDTMYSEKLSHLRRLELEFWHPKEERDSAGNYVDETKNSVQDTFQLRNGQRVQLRVCGCRAVKRMKMFKSGMSLYESILSLHSCPRIGELSAMEEIIATKSICKNICKMLPTPDLLRCYRVNRNWNAAAREELYGVRSCTLALRPMKFGDLWTRTAVTQLFGANEKLFNGLSLRICPFFGQNTISAEASTEILDSADLNIAYSHFKALKVQGLDEDYPLLETNKSEHPVLISMRAGVVQLFHTLLTKLEIDRVQTLVGPIENFDELFRDAEGKLFVPNLKSIKFVDPEKLPEHDQVFKRLLVDLESLERIDVPFSNELLPLVSSAGRAHCVKHIQLYKLPENELRLPGSILSQTFEPETEMALDAPRTGVGSLLKFAQEQQPLIETIFLGDSVALGNENFPVFHKLFHVLCTSSYGTLRSLHLSLSFLNLISKVYSRPLVTLQKIQLVLDKNDSGRLLLQIPFTHIAPNLEDVELSHSKCYSFEKFPEEQSRTASAALKLEPCVSVKSLKMTVFLKDSTSKELISSCPEPWNIEFIARLFPQVTNLSFSWLDFSGSRSGNVFLKMLSSAWESWPNLQSLKLYSSATIDALSFETWVLGISSAEWSLWSLKNKLEIPDHLHCLHYAPASSSFRNCKNLRDLGINGSIETRLLARTFHKDGDKIYLLPRNAFES